MSLFSFGSHFQGIYLTNNSASKFNNLWSVPASTTKHFHVIKSTEHLNSCKLSSWVEAQFFFWRSYVISDNVQRDRIPIKINQMASKSTVTKMPYAFNFHRCFTECWNLNTESILCSNEFSE